jgi:aspartyl-tRNA(Asn)/glutamyl-tRNA(Gln) amidotransferase subunit C
MELSLAQVEYVAHLARLALDEGEKTLFREQLASILDYAEALQRPDTDAIPATATILPLENVMRDDSVQPSLARAAVLGSTSFTEDGCFRVPAVLETDG